MSNKIFLFVSIYLISIPLFSQSGLLNSDDPEKIGTKTSYQKSKDKEEYLEYPHVEEKDILFSKVVWEFIDLNQRANFHLLYPTVLEAVGKERRPLIHYIIEGIKEGKIDKIYSDGQFNNKKSLEAFERQLVDSVYTPDGEDKVNKFGSVAAFLKDKGVENPYIDMTMDEVDALNDDDYNVRESKLRSLSFPFLNRGEDYQIRKFTYDMVEQYKIKGVWYFDKKISELVYRPLAIAPITKSVKNRGGRNKDDLSELVWVFYRSAREYLKDAYVFSPKNSVVRKSFDEIINERRFISVIYLEENMYEDREVKDYMQNNSFMRLLESERIKEKIRNFEHDMWSW